jgi:isoleucyl-tRNA synthetase
VHLETFPEIDGSLHDPELEKRFEALLGLRGVIAQAVEPARKEKLIGNALEAAVTLEVGDAELASALQADKEELEELFILSDLTIVAGTETIARLVRTEQKKCSRCWRHRLTVGVHPEHPELCDRCAKVVTAAA